MTCVAAGRLHLMRLAGFLLLAGLAAAPATAQTAPAPLPPLPAAFYQAKVVTTGSDTRYRAAGFAEALRIVLVRVSGDPDLAGDPRVAALAAHADGLVASYSYRDQLAGIPRHDDQGSYDRPFDLTVRFDPARVDATLRGLGETPWRGPRPEIVPAIVVRGFDQPYQATYLLGAGTQVAKGQRDSLVRVAAMFGMRVHVPTAAELATWGVATTGFPVPHVPAAHGRVVVSGTLTFRTATLGWVGVWRMRWKNDIHVWSIAGVGYDVAFRDLVAGVVRVASGHGPPGGEPVRK